MKTAEDILSEKTRRLISVPYDTPIFESVQQMVSQKIGAILVEKEGTLVGIWTERDFLRNSIEEGFDPKRDKIGDHMVSPLISVSMDTPLVKLQEMFIGLFIRHILIKEDETYIGMLSIGDVMRCLMLEKDHQIKELNKIASWEYYENWGWHHKHGKKK